MFSTSAAYHSYKLGFLYQVEGQTHNEEASHTLKYWSSKLQRSGFSNSSGLLYIKTWVFKYLLSSSNLPYQNLKELVVDLKTSGEALGLAFAGKNRWKLSKSSKKFQRLYSHIFLNLYIIYLPCISLVFCKLEILSRTNKKKSPIGWRTFCVQLYQWTQRGK